MGFDMSTMSWLSGFKSRYSLSKIVGGFASSFFGEGNTSDQKLKANSFASCFR
jgi:hypothetical protein